ncbi:phage tail tape measure protein, partial [Pseudomonas sp. AL15]|uniref:phage tail tape measure protein n=1 Tax=Pseudomonas sp. AL15 TaxID=3042236 RepID=UPI00249ADBA8
GYGIYRKQFEAFGSKTIEGWQQLSAEERDMKFGEYFSAGIASSVRAFKTDGQQMSAAISALGAAATSSNVPFAEQLSILGQLQTTMSGSEAATKYRAFLSKATKAGEALNLEFLDANDRLRSMPEILEELRSKYGDTIDDI